jgi:hypothetical protein
MSTWTSRRIWKGPGADSEETHEPVSDRHRPVDSLKALDPNGPIREVDIATTPTHVRFKAVSGGFAISAKGQKRTLATRVAIESGADPSAMFGASDRMMAQAKRSTS